MKFNPKELKLTLFILVPVILRALTPVLLKKASLSMEEFTLINVLTNFLYWLSFAFFFVMALTWQIVLRKTALSYAYPYTGLSYVFIMLIGYFYFNENISISQIAGVLLIISGTIIFVINKDDD